jgi:hypothetical protein
MAVSSKSGRRSLDVAQAELDRIPESLRGIGSRVMRAATVEPGVNHQDRYEDGWQSD